MHQQSRSIPSRPITLGLQSNDDVSAEQTETGNAGAQICGQASSKERGVGNDYFLANSAPAIVHDPEIAVTSGIFVSVVKASSPDAFI